MGVIAPSDRAALRVGGETGSLSRSTNGVMLFVAAAAMVIALALLTADPETRDPIVRAAGLFLVVVVVAIVMRGVREREEKLRAEVVRAAETAEFLRALAELTLGALNQDGLPATLHLVCERARRLLGCDVAAISLLESDTLSPRAVFPAADDIVMRSLEVGEETSPTAAAARECRVILAQGSPLEPWRISDDMTARGVHRVLALPLVGRKGRLVGVLTCGDGGTSRDLDLLQVRGELLAAQTTAAIERVALVDRLREEAESVHSLLRVSRDIGHEAPVGEVVVTVCRLARELLAADDVAMLGWDEERESFASVAHAGMSAAEAERGVPVNLAAGDGWRFGDVEEGRLIAAPLTHAGRTFGMLVARRVTTAGRFGDRQVALMEGIARQCGMALDNLRLLVEERTAASLALTLLNVGQEFSLAVDPASLLSEFASRALELTGAAAVVVAVREPDDGLYHIGMVQGLPPEQTERLRALEMDDATLALHLAHAAGAGSGGGRHLSVPMERAGERVGVVLLVWGEGEGPTHRESTLALGLANQAAIALETVRLVYDSREASRLKSDFVATMSHELRTPLNVIMGYTDLLLEDAFGGLNEEQHGVLTRTQRSARELLDLITATLDLNRLEAGKSRISVERVTVADLFAQLEAWTAALLDRGNLEVRWRIEGDVPPIETDLAKLSIVLKNLIGNAIKFTEEGSVTVVAEPVDGAVTFTVADTGVGIKREDLPVIFEMFRQVESANTRRHGGVGLGLYIVKRYLTELRGEIDVVSEAGSGSRFRIRLPLRLPPSAVAPTDPV
jgi:signal transduction histidine kinase